MNYNLLEINHQLFSATILEQGAQIIHFQPNGKEPFLWSAPIDTYIHGKPFRGGIPICWPWFGKEQSPSHGFARITDWELESRIDSDNGVLLRWALRDSDASRAIWNHSFKLTLDMYLCETCTLRLKIDAPVATTGALHTYLYSANVREEWISGLGKSYIDSLLNDELVSATDEVLLIDKAIDRIYPHNLSETLLGDKLIVKHDNHSDVVAWNPWQEGVKNIADMSNDDYLHMVCIETARISNPFENIDSIGVEISCSR